MSMTFTPDQQKVIEIRSKNILVSAAAGSGKTAVLVERIVRIVADEADPVDIDRLLVVTFTHMAAGEMRERIGLALGKRLEQEPENAHLQRQMTLIHNAQITTIDSFCLFILRNHFHVIGLDPGFRVADEGELKLLAQDVMAELLEEWYGKASTEFLNCVDYFTTGSRDKQLEDYISRLYLFAMSFPWPEEWLSERKTDYAVTTVAELEASGWGQFLFHFIKEILAGCAGEISKCIGICEQPDGPYMYGRVLEEELQMLLNAEKATSLVEYAEFWPKITFGRLPSKKDDTVAGEKRELVQEIRSRVKETVKETGERFFTLTPEQAVERMAGIRDAAAVLLDLVLDYKGKLDQAKREKNIIDFSDMEHFALAILLEKNGAGYVPTVAARELREHFVEILTDEYQDSNMVQELLLQSISGEDEGRFNRFMVGDVKQSIYKFRLARPEIFMEKYDCYPLTEGGSESAASESGASASEPPYPSGQQADRCERIDLRRNFRSRPEVLDSVNYIFEKIMRKSLGGVEYDRRAALYPGAAYPEKIGTATGENKSELLLLDLGETGKDAVDGAEEEIYTAETPKELEARMIARRIKELAGNFQVTDKASGGLRPACFRDMVILLRTNAGWDEVFKKILEEEGVPVHTIARTGYFETTEIRTVLQVVRVLDNPLQDIPLFGVMKSFFGGFDEEEIVRIRTGSGLPEPAEGEEGKEPFPQNGSLFQKLTWWAERLPADMKKSERLECQLIRASDAERPEQQSARVSAFERLTVNTEASGLHNTQWLSADVESLEKISSFLTWLEIFRRKSIYVPIQDLLKELIIDSGYYHHIAVRPAGEQRVANLEMLLVKAAAFARTSYYGLFHFVRYIEQLEKYDVDYGEANILDEQADVVRLMSIHKSKGLEFPICFVAGLAKGFNMQDSYSGMIADVDLGIGVDYVNAELRLQSRSLRKSVISQKMKMDSLGEELRVLYVAMTRAKEKLILSGAVKKIKPFPELRERLSFLQMIGAGSYLDFLLPVLLGEEARVKEIEDEEIKTARVEIKAEKVHFDIRIINKTQLLAAEIEERLTQSARRKDLITSAIIGGRSLSATENEKMTMLSQRFARSYPRVDLAKLYAKTTVTELKKAEQKVFSAADESDGGVFVKQLYEEPEVIPYIPLFMKGKEDMTGAVRGSAYHKVMELLSFREIPLITEPKQLERETEKQLKQVLAEGRLTPEYYQVVRPSRISDFLRTPLAARMIAADRAGKLYKEQPFVIGLDADRLGNDFAKEETILIQGIIDVFFEEDGQLVVADYKTDAVKTSEELLERYRVQLDYYAEALEQLTGKKVKEKIIYSFALNKEIQS